MSAAILFQSDVLARRQVNETLRGPVMEVLRGLLPAVDRLPRGAAFEAVLNDCTLLSRCFLAFRQSRSRFRPLLVGRDRRPVFSDNQPLACGRTINQIIAMVVRSAAKRHFRQRLDDPSSRRRREERRVAPPATTGFDALADWLGLRHEQARAERVRPDISRADALYVAIRAYLLHDWQASMIPHYARMTPDEVRDLGARILDFQQPEQLLAYLDQGRSPWDEAEGKAVPTVPEALPLPRPLSEFVAVDAEAMPEPSPAARSAPVPQGLAALPTAPLASRERARISDVLTDDGRGLRMDTMADLLRRPHLRAVLGDPHRDALLAAARAMSRTGSAAVRRLVVDLGLSAEQLAAVLGQMALMLPPEVYVRLFGRAGDAAVVQALVRRARLAGHGAHSPLSDLTTFVRAMFGRFLMN